MTFKKDISMAHSTILSFKLVISKILNRLCNWRSPASSIKSHSWNNKNNNEKIDKKKKTNKLKNYYLPIPILDLGIP